MRPSLLLLDDDADLRDILAGLLTSHGYDVIAGGDGRSGLDQIRARGIRPSVILLDMHMPGMDGWRFLDELHAHALLATVPVVVLTSEAPPASGPPRGVHAWLPKETPLAGILSALTRATDAARRRRRARRARAWVLGALASAAVLVGLLAPKARHHGVPQLGVPQAVG